jgi:uncharacterized protein YjlB
MAGRTNEHFEQIRHATEWLTGVGRPPTERAKSFVRDRKPVTHHFADDGETPNNPDLPLIHYHAARDLAGDYDPAAVFEVLFRSNGWSGSWRDGVYPFLHFHTQTHEVLGIARGHAAIEFGGKGGKLIEVKAGDVIILPAGVGHQRCRASRDLLVVGAYPQSGRYNEPRPNEIEHAAAVASIAAAHLPDTDPVYGRSGPLMKAWTVCDAGNSNDRLIIIKESRMARAKNGKTMDAVALLKADHRKVEELFEKYEKAKGNAAKKKLAEQICLELSVHTELEEKVFYPACEGAVEEDMLDEAQVEHDGAKMLIAELLAGDPSDDYYDAKVKVLSEEIKHHVKEEEQPGGVFSQARKNGDLDLKALGAQMAAMKADLTKEQKASGIPTPITRSMKGAKVVTGQPVA